MTTPQTGITVRAHVEQLLISAACVIDRARSACLLQQRRMRVAEREQLRRDLAGVISACETVRIWLDKGAPN